MTPVRLFVCCVIAWSFSFGAIYSLYDESSRVWLAYLGASFSAPLYATVGAIYAERGVRWRK